MVDKVLRRKLYAMVVGVLGLLGGIAFFASDTIGLSEIGVITLLFTVPAIMILSRARRLYGGDPDPIEVLMMMLAGAFAFLSVSVALISVVDSDFVVAVVSLLIFGTPAAIFWIINTRRRTERLTPT